MKKNTVKRFIVLPLFLSLYIIAMVGLTYRYPLETKQGIYKKCVTHIDFSKTHTHAMLTITQDERKIKVPANLGITSTCMHPLHTQDETGLIHMEYQRNIKYTLGDVFDLMGVVLNNTQIGSLRAQDGYVITVKKNGKRIKSSFRNILLKDHDKVSISAVSPE